MVLVTSEGCITSAINVTWNKLLQMYDSPHSREKLLVHHVALWWLKVNISVKCVLLQMR